MGREFGVEHHDLRLEGEDESAPEMSVIASGNAGNSPSARAVDYAVKFGFAVLFVPNKSRAHKSRSTVPIEQVVGSHRRAPLICVELLLTMKLMPSRRVDLPEPDE